MQIAIIYAQKRKISPLFTLFNHISLDIKNYLWLSANNPGPSKILLCGGGSDFGLPRGAAPCPDRSLRRSQEPGETIGMLEDWNYGMMTCQTPSTTPKGFSVQVSGLTLYFPFSLHLTPETSVLVIRNLEFSGTLVLHTYLFMGVTTSIGNLKMLRFNSYNIQQKMIPLELTYGSY